MRADRNLRAYRNRIVVGILVAAGCCLLASCAKTKAAWHPDKDGSGAWYDAAHARVLGLARSDTEQGLFELTRFSLDPKENRVVYMSFAAKGADGYANPDDASFTISIKGSVLSFSGKTEDGGAFTETYKAVDRAFLRKKAAVAESKRASLAAKKDPSMIEQQEVWILEMIAQTLNGLKLPE